MNIALRLMRSLVLILAWAAAAYAADEIHWTILGQTSVAFDWRGTENTIRYGLTSQYGQTVTAISPNPLPYSSSGPFWEATLTGLQENTVYHYSIGTGSDHTFRTPPPRGGSGFTVMVEADIGSSSKYPRVTTVQRLIADQRPDFVLCPGDLTYGNSHGQQYVDIHFNDVMAWSQDAAYMPAWGNHEWDKSTDDLRNYKGRFKLPNPQTSPGSPSVSCCGEDWYWFDYGNVRFIAYPEPWSGTWADWNRRADALMDEAQNDAAIKFVVTYGHRPAFSSGHHPGNSTLAGYLGALGASHSKYVLNLNGHSHNYERTHPQSGVIHITSGAGGSTLEEDGSCLWLSGCTPPSWTAFRAMHHGALKLRFNSNSIEGFFMCGPPGDSGSNRNDITCELGAVMDSFIISTDGDVISPAPTTSLRVR